jgi:hypothetical protein
MSLPPPTPWFALEGEIRGELLWRWPLGHGLLLHEPEKDCSVSGGNIATASTKIILSYPSYL